MTRPTYVILVSLVLAGCEQGDPPSKSTTNPASGASKVITVDPHDVLFSTPTLNDSIPVATNVAVPKERSYAIHEDDWRQFEFVAASHLAEIDKELEAIDKIWKEQSVSLGDTGTAFRNIHVRKLIATPLDIPMSVAEFERLLGGQAFSMTWIGSDRALQGVHAVTLQDVTIYAVIDQERLSTLGIEPHGQFAIGGETADRLEKLITQHDLRLVHWRSRTLFETPQSAAKYLRGKAVRE